MINSTQYLLLWEKVTTILLNYRTIVIFLWFVFTLVAFITSVGSNTYWNVWAVWSLVITLGYGLFYYFEYLGTILPQIKIVEGKIVRLNLLSSSLVLIPLILAITALFIYVPNRMWEHHLKYYHVFSFATVFFFLFEDVLVYYSLKMTKEMLESQYNKLQNLECIITAADLAANVSWLTIEKVNDLVKLGQIQYCENNREEGIDKESMLYWYKSNHLKKLSYESYLNFIKYIDAPTLGAVVAIILFGKLQNFGFDIEVFSLGATAFQLLAFNLIFTITLIIEMIKQVSKKEVVVYVQN